MIKILGYVLVGFYIFFELSCYVILHRFRSDIVIRKRNTVMICICTIASWLSFIALHFSVFGNTPFNCGVFYIATILIPPLSVGPQLLRGITLWGMLEYNRLMVEYGETTHLRRTVAKTAGIGGLDAINEVSSSSKDEESGSMREVSLIEGIPQNDIVKRNAIAMKQKMRTLVQVTRWILIVTTSALIVALLASTDKGQLASNNFEECFPEPELITIMSWGLGIVLSLAAFSTTILVRHCDDELGIRFEITRNIVILFVTNVTVFVMKMMDQHEWQPIILSFQQILLSFSMIILPCWSSRGGDILNWITKRSKLIPSYARPLPGTHGRTNSLIIPRRGSQGVKKDSVRDREMTMSLDAGLIVLLSSIDGVQAFTDHCSREFSVENIRFWKVVNEFHQTIDVLRAPTCEDKSEHDEGDLKAFAQEIYDEYIKVGAQFQINISSEQSSAIRQGLNSVDKLNRRLFDNAQNEIFSLMSRHSYPRFLASKHHSMIIPTTNDARKRRFSVVPV